MPVQNYSRNGGFEGDYYTIDLPEPGRYRIDYSRDFYGVPDEIEIRYGGRMLVDTGLSSYAGSGSFVIEWQPGGASQLQIVLGANPTIQTTLWEYHITVKPLDEDPVAHDDTITIEDESPVVIPVLSNDEAGDTPLDPSTITIVKQPHHGTISIDAGQITYTPHDQARDDSFTYTVADEDGDVSNVATVTLDGPCEEPEPLLVTGTHLEHDEALGVCVGEADYYVGRTDGTEQMLWVRTGTVRVGQHQLEVLNGVVQPVIGGIDKPLFVGNVTFDRTGKGVVQDAGGNSFDEFAPGGLDFDVMGLQLDPNEIRVDGHFKLPGAVGGLDVNLAGLKGLVIDSDGVRLGSGEVKLPKHTFDLFEVLKVEASSWSAGYDAAENIIKIQGKLALQTPFFTNDGLSGGTKIEMDLAGSNYIKIKDGGADLQGVISLKDLAMTPHWGFKELSLYLRAEGGVAKEATGTAKVQFPFKGAAAVAGGKLGLILDPDLELNTIGFSVDDGLNIPIGTTGVIWQKVIGSVTGLSPQDPEGIQIDGTLGFSIGPKQTFQLPEWIKPEPVSAAAATLDLSGLAAVSTQTGDFSLGGGLVLKIITDGVFDLSASGNVNLTAIKASGTASIKAMGGIFTGSSKYNFDFKAGTASAQGTGSMQVPDIKAFAALRGLPVPTANDALVFSNDSNYANDYVAVWGTVGGALAITAGMKLSFDGSFDTIIGSGEAPLIGSWDVGPDQPYFVMTADWENAQADPVAFRVTYEDDGGNLTVYEQADFSTAGIQIVADLTGQYTLAVAVVEPTPGIWDIEIVDTAPLGAVDYHGYGGGGAPEITVTAASVSTESGYRIVIDYEAFDADTNAQVALYYDTDQSDFDGVLIVSGLEELDGSGTYTWNPVGAPEGDLYLYAVATAPNGLPVFSDYLPTPVQGPPETDVAIEVTGPDEMPRDGFVVYDVVISNGSGARAEDVAVNIGVAGSLASFKFVLEDGSEGYVFNETELFELGGLDAGESATIRIETRPHEDAIAVEVRADVSTGNEDGDGSNDIAVKRTVVDEGGGEIADLSIERVVRVLPEDDPEGHYRYDLIVRNNGPGVAEHVEVVDSVLETDRFGLSLDIERTDGWGFEREGNEAIWTIPRLAPGEEAVLPLRFGFDDDVPFTFRGRVGSESFDPYVGNNTTVDLAQDFDTVTAPLVEPADLILHAEVTDPAPAVGESVTLRVDIGKQSAMNEMVAGVQVKIETPEGVDLVTWNPSHGEFDGTTGIWTLGTMRRSEETITLQYEVQTDQPVSFVPEIWAMSMPDRDSTPGNGDHSEDDIQIVTINGTNQAPEVDVLIGDQTALPGQPLSFTIPGNAFTDPGGDPLTYSLTQLPDWLDYDPETRTLSGTPEASDFSYVHGEVTVRAGDGRGGYAEQSFHFLSGGNAPPVVVKEEMDRTVSVGSPVSLRVSSHNFEDPEDPEAVPELSVSGLPSWASYEIGEVWEDIGIIFSSGFPGESTNGPGADQILIERYILITGTPGADDAGSHEITVTADDGNGGVESDTFTLVVNPPPTVEQPVDDATFDGAGEHVLTIPSESFGAAEGVALEVTASLASGDDLPPWLAFDGGTLTFSGNPAPADEGTYDIRLLVADGYGGFVTETFTLTVQDANDAPTGIFVPDPEVSENMAAGTVVSGVGTFDPDFGDAHTVSLVEDSGGRFGIDARGRLITLRGLDFEAQASHEVRVRSTDSRGAAIEATVAIAVLDMAGPLFDAGANSVDFDVIAPEDYDAGSQYDALDGDDVVTLPSTAASAVAAGYDTSAPFAAGAGRDLVRGGGMSDHILGGAGDDTLEGGDGDDTLNGGIDRDVIDGGAGFDIIDYRFATSVLDVSLARGDLRLTGTVGAWETFTGIEGVIGGMASDRIEGDAGANRLVGGPGQDTLLGGEGDDTLDGGIGADTFDGGEGSDTVDYGFAPAGVRLDIDLARGDMRFVGDAEPVEVIVAIENVIGGDGADRLTGDGGANVLDGGSGSDLLSGGGGDDTLIGGVGQDSFDGGAGTDTVDYGFANAATRLDVDLARGDMRLAGGPTALEPVANIENVIGGGGADRLTGDDGSNVLDGGSGSDLLSGGGGDDTLIGGIGQDSFDGGAGTDTVDYSFANAATRLDVDLARGDMRLAGGPTALEPVANIENVIGGDGADRLTGDDGANVLDGGSGSDLLTGGGGDDTLIGGIGQDSFDGGAGTDTIDYSFANAATRLDVDLARGDMRLVGGPTALEPIANIENVIGGDGADVLKGNSANNVLIGQAGNDRFVYSGGNDVIGDFEGGPGVRDVVDLTGHSSLTSFAAVEAAMAASGGDTVIDLGGGDTLTLKDLVPSQLVEDDFLI